jgi:predicted transposase/invertase (TIGR01784 family)
LQLEYDKELDRLRGLNVAVESAKMEGRAEGAREATLASARNFKALGVLTTEQIAQATGLSVEEVAAL